MSENVGELSPPSNCDKIAVSEDEDMDDEDRPVDLRNNLESLANNPTPYSILGNYLSRPGMPEPRPEERGQYMNQKQLHEQIAAMLMHQNGILPPPGGPRPASRDSRGVSAEDRDDLEEEKGLSMQLGMQMDMANLLRSQFNASMPTQVRMMESGGLEIIRNPFAGLPRPESWTEHGLGGSECWQAQPSPDPEPA